MPVSLTDDLLLSVARPARYVGGEINTAVKDHAHVRASIALAFPDVYDIAMEYQGFHILYPLVNARSGFLAERVCCPWPDMADAMRARRIPLHGLESRTPVRDFSLIGFTLQHELNYTNILEMLDLAGLPPLAEERPDLFPIVIAGGPGALAPEPLAPFIDAFVIGEGEELVIDLLEICARHRVLARSHSRTPARKEALLLEIANLPGMYVPRFYAPPSPVGKGDGGLGSEAVHRTRDDVPASIIRRLFDISKETWSVRPVVPLQRVNGDRFSLEIKRGCTRGCRFCQAGMITRPMRERTPEQILDLTGQGLANTGYRQVSLVSLSSADYSALAPLMREINRRHERDHVSIALSSLRVNAFDVQFADEISKVKKTGFTFAPEAGTERLRSVINKELSDERFLNVAAHVFSRGWRRLKYYFMCGLPTETDEDLLGIVEITRRSLAIGRRFCGGNFEIAVSVSPFIPKAHTPFQWEPQLDPAEVDRRWHLVADNLRGRNVVVRRHSADQAWVEGILAKGDRRVGHAMLRAWRAGARFCSWDDHFRLDAWRRALAEEGIDVGSLIHTRWDYERPTPWDHIEAALGKPFLIREHRKALAQTLTADCAFDRCAGCDSCDFEAVKNIVVLSRPQNTYESLGDAPPPPESLRRAPPARTEPEPAVRLRVRLTKRGVTKYLSHLDYARTVHQIIARARLPVAFSGGFHPKPRVMFTPAIPLGYTSVAEGADIVLDEEADPDLWIASLRDATVPGIDWTFVAFGHPHDANIQSEVTHADYTVTISDPQAVLGIDVIELRHRIAEFLALQSCVVHEKAHESGKVKKKDYRGLTIGLQISESTNQRVNLLTRLACGGGGALDPLRLLSHLVASAVTLGDHVAVERTAVWADRAGGLDSLLEPHAALQSA